MAHFQMSKTVQAPPDRVFGAFTDLQNAAARIRGISRIELLTPGPVCVGTRFRETRRMFGKEATEEMTVTAYEPPRLYAMGADSCGMRYATTFRFAPDGGGTRVDVEMVATAQTITAKIMGLLMGWIMAPMMRKCFAADMDDMAAAAEGRPVTK